MKHRPCGYPQISRFADAKQLSILSWANLIQDAGPWALIPFFVTFIQQFSFIYTFFSVRLFHFIFELGSHLDLENLQTNQSKVMVASVSFPQAIHVGYFGLQDNQQDRVHPAETK